MFMDNAEWSEDDIDDTLVVPMDSGPKPMVLSSGGGMTSNGSDSQSRASSYNERMARARNAMGRKPSHPGGSCANAHIEACVHPRL
jgi:hypothetical protein